MRFVIDTDMGIDDAVALLMFLAHPTAEIEAITSVVGNVSLAQATLNVGVVLDVANAPHLPIFGGCGKPLLQNEPVDAVDVHATDGLGGAGRAQTNRPIEVEHAVTALIRLARANAGQLSLLTLGPLTNIALAVRLAPDFLNRFERIVIMAGAVEGRGNTTPAAEFNIAVDPEAASVVFSACRDVAERVWLVSWEASLRHATPFDTWRRLIEGHSAQAKFVRAMTDYIEQVLASSYSAIPWADPLAAAVALEPALVSAYEARFVQVEIGHNVGRGSTIVDYRARSTSTANMNVVRAVDKQRFETLLRSVV